VASAWSRAWRNVLLTSSLATSNRECILNIAFSDSKPSFVINNEEQSLDKRKFLSRSLNPRPRNSPQEFPSQEASNQPW
jgi:hypothetical protein